jgi:hypothetical protein
LSREVDVVQRESVGERRPAAVSGVVVVWSTSNREERK